LKRSGSPGRVNVWLVNAYTLNVYFRNKAAQTYKSKKAKLKHQYTHKKTTIKTTVPPMNSKP